MTQALLTDLYQLTMAQGHWRLGRQRRRGVFQAFFRRPPFGGAFVLHAGLAPFLEDLSTLRFDRDSLEYLRSLPNPGGSPLFEPAFLDELSSLKLELDIYAMPEGTLAFPNEPMLRVEGGILQAQLVETLLLNRVGFQSLIATKAARMRKAAGAKPIAELGLRRAHGPDGGLSASRAAFLGGVAATSNVLAGQRFGIPVVGTMAHSWVMSFESELAAFRAHAAAHSGDASLLVDTYDAVQGIENAIIVGKELSRIGRRLGSIRLDSGDLVAQSRHARQRLDREGLTTTSILASDDLDEHRIAALERDGGAVDQYGVGTRLVTGGDHPALGLVYKLSAFELEPGRLVPVQKRPRDSEKTSLPGSLGVTRHQRHGEYSGDTVAPVESLPHDLLQLVWSRGRPTPTAQRAESLLDARERAARELKRLPDRHQRLERPDPYPVQRDLRDGVTMADFVA